MAPSASPLWPASVTALFASGWPANHWPVCAPTVPMALLNPDTVQSASADAVGSATVVAANPPSTPAARTPAIPRRTVLRDICTPHSYVATLHGPPTQWVSTHSTDARIYGGHRENFRGNLAKRPTAGCSCAARALRAPRRVPGSACCGYATG